MALIRGELRTLWSWSDAPEADDKKETLLDDTIEAPSEIAAKARQAVKEDNVEQVAQQVIEHVEEDDSWMENTTDGSTPSVRKRKGGKKK